MEFKLKSGRKLKTKNISIDERDEMMDSITYESDKDGNPTKISMMHSTMTKWIRIGIDGDTSDKFIKSLSFKDKSSIFTKIQSECMNLGEGKASK